MTYACAEILRKRTHALTFPQYLKYKSCVFSAAKSCSHWLSHPHCAGARISYIYIPTCIYLLFSMTVRNATFLRKLYFRYFCRDRRDRLGTAVGTAVFYVGTVGTAWLRSQKRTLLKRSLRSLHKIQRSLERSLGGPYSPYKKQNKNELLGNNVVWKQHHRHNNKILVQGLRKKRSSCSCDLAKTA